MKNPRVPSREEIDRLLKQAEEGLWTGNEIAEKLIEQGLRDSRAAQYPYAELSFRVLEAEVLSNNSLEESRAAYVKAIAQSHRKRYGGLESRAITGLAFADYHLTGDAIAALKHLDRAVSLAEEYKDLTAQGCALEGLCNVRYIVGDLVGAAEAGLAAFSAFEAGGHVSAARNSLLNLGSLLYTSGRWDDALRLAEQATEERNSEAAQTKQGKGSYGDAITKDAPAPPTPYVLIHAAQLKGLVHMRLGNLEEALAFFRRAYTLSIEAGFVLKTDTARRYVGCVLSDMGRYEEALVELAPIFTSHQGVEVMQAHVIMAIAYIGLKDYANAEETLATFRDKYSAEAPRMILQDYYRIKSRLHRARGEFELALLAKEESEGISASANTSPSVQSRMTQTYLLLQMERDKHAREMERIRVLQMERDLSNTTLQLISQTEVLSELREDLMRMTRKISSTEPLGKELRDRIKDLPCKSVDWAKFDTQFKAAHPEFTKRLIELYPTLSSQELRICSLLRMNLKSEEMARLLCLSERTIESHRLRIRRKMKLTQRDHDLMLHLAKL